MVGTWQGREFETGTAIIVKEENGRDDFPHDYRVYADAPHNRATRGVILLAVFLREYQAKQLCAMVNQ
jgi:hypothetical protein